MKLFFLFLLLLVSCKATVQGTRLRIEMNAPQQAVLLIVNDKGVISYGGGLNAIENKTTWQGTMTPEQHAEFTSLLSTWNLGNTKESVGEGVGKYTVRLQEGSKDDLVELPLTDTTATHVYALLMDVADKRFNETLDALPKPSVDAMLQNRGLGENK